MRDLYKQKTQDMLSSIDGKLKIIEGMIDGTKQANPTDAKRYLHEIANSIDKVREMISIS